MNLNNLNTYSSHLPYTDKMPVLFVGHGSPMNAIEENVFVKGFRNIGNSISKPNAIICVSAHWETAGTKVTAMPFPKTIHDFGGFPQVLYDIQYPAPGSPELAKTTQSLITKTEIELDENWGLDHGAWSVIKHLYPLADIPIIQLSLDYTKPIKYHFELAKELQDMRNKGILIVGSGNIIHNLNRIAWDKINENFAYDWAMEANEKIKELIQKEDFQSLINYSKLGKAFEWSIPTPEHFLPLLYILALKNSNETIEFFNDLPIAGSLSMTSLKIS